MSRPRDPKLPRFSLFGLVNRLNRAGHAAGSLMLGGAVILLLTEIIARRLFETSTTIAEEYTGYFCAGAIFLGAARTFSQDHHIRADLVLNMLSVRARRFAEFFATLCALACSCFLVTGMYRQWWDVWTMQSHSFYPSRTLLWLPLAIPLVGMALFSIQLVMHLLETKSHSGGVAKVGKNNE